MVLLVSAPSDSTTRPEPCRGIIAMPHFTLTPARATQKREASTMARHTSTIRNLRTRAHGAIA